MKVKVHLDNRHKEQRMLRLILVNLYYSLLDSLRANAEMDRIIMYKNVARKSAIAYYKILKRMSGEGLTMPLIEKKNPQAMMLLYFIGRLLPLII
jgi:hypothetical protein